MSKVKFGVRIPASGPASSSQRLIDCTREAEDLGYDAVFANEHIHNSFERHKQSAVGMGSHKESSNTSDPNQFETVANFAFLAGMTRKLELGVGVMPLLLRDPIILANQLATLEALSGGRFILGVGVSNTTDKEEFRALGIPFPPYAERYEIIGEYVAAMREIWERPRASFQGKHVRFNDLVIYPKPARRIPIWVGCETLSGGADHPAVKFALQHADGWLFGLLRPPEEVKQMTRDFTETARGAGSDVSTFDFCLELRLSIGETMEEVRGNVEWIRNDQPDTARYAGWVHQREVEGTTRKVDTAADGKPDAIQAKVQEFIEAGVTYFDLFFMYRTYETMVKQMRLFASQVLPAFR